MRDLWPTWLAWRFATGSGADGHKLALHLQKYGASGFDSYPGPRPGDEHLRAGERSATAMVRLGLNLIPVWQLPAYLCRVSPLPMALYVRGNPDLIARRPAVSIIGARQASAMGCRWAHNLARNQARNGRMVVSGGALGVDSAAHRGSLAAGAPTLAYIGTAIDRIYPAANADLFAAMLETDGALVSEHPPGAVTFKSAHAMRNRFIAAHGDCLVLAEAALKSGTLSTVTYASRLSTPVWVAPEHVGGERSGLGPLVASGRAQLLGEGSQL